MTPAWSRSLLGLLGLELTPNHHAEKLLSGLGGFVGIILVIVVTTFCVGAQPATLIIASMAASAVLLFAAPHGPLSQPWPLLGGHLISAVIGVACQQLIPWSPLAAAAAVGLAITVMYYTRCLHPPGGATAFTAVLGGPAIHALGFSYVLAPVLINAVILLVVAIAFNYPLAWRRYPAALVRRHTPTPTRAPQLSHEHLAYALRQMGSLIDITEDDLVEIYSLALHHARGTHLKPEQIRVGRAYANSPAPGSGQRSIRQVVDELPGSSVGAADDLVLYWTLDGPPPHRVAVCPRSTFALWACEEVISTTPVAS